MQDAQLGTGKTMKVTIGQAVKDGLVDNETLGYFMTRTQLYLEMVSYVENDDPFCLSGFV